MAATTLTTKEASHFQAHTTKEASHFQAHTSKEASHFQAHTSKASTTKDTSLQLQLETSSFSHTTHNPSSSQLTPDDTSLRADTSRQQTMTPINQTCHEIDVSHYVPADDVADLLSQSVMVNPDHDPFDAELIREFLAGLERPIESYPTYHAVNESLPAFRVRNKVPLGRFFLPFKHTFTLFNSTLTMFYQPNKPSYFTQQNIYMFGHPRLCVSHNYHPCRVFPTSL